MYKNLTITSFLGLLAVVLGAFGAHALREKLTPEAFQSFETAVKYQMFHVLVLLFINTFKDFSEKFKAQVSLLFFIGILFFSGSIYLIHIGGVSVKSIWFITPLGGVFFIVGWFLLFIKFIKKFKNQ